MTTEIPILGNFAPDAGVYWSKLASEMTLTNAKGQFCWVLAYPTGADLGGSFNYKVPSNYASDPVLVIRGIIDGTPANTFAVGTQFLELAVSSTVDAAYETADLANNATWTGYADEEEYEITIAMTPASNFTPGRQIYQTLFRDDSVDNTTWNLLMTYLGFRYTEA